jgi:intergrase/recombinase
MGLPGFEPGSRAPEALKSVISLNWLRIRDDFLKWLESKNYSREYAKRIVSELDKRVSVISTPMDVVNLFRGLTCGQQHNLDRAVRAFFNFHQEVLGVDEGFLNALRRAIPREVEGVDLTIPSEDEVVSSLRRLRRAPLKYQGFYSLLLDSGLRITEAARLINNSQKPEKVNGFYRCKLGYFRGSKCAYFAYFTIHTFNLIRKINCGFRGDSASHYFAKRGYVKCKHLRKFAFDKMIELGIPESVADFIQGRVPQRIGAKHYMALARQADQKYGRYAEYLTELRRKAGLIA